MLTVRYNTTGTLKATLTDDEGDAVTGATVTVTIKNSGGTALATDQAMTEVGVTGIYEYTIAADLLPGLGHGYKAEITATKSGNQAYAEIRLVTEVVTA